MHLALFFVGLGSACFHATLRHTAQMLDELPMVYSLTIWWYVLARINDDLKLPCKQSGLGKESSSVLGSLLHEIKHLDWLPYFLVAYCILWTVVHSMQTFTTVFQVHFILQVVIGFGRIAYILYKLRQRPSPHPATEIALHVLVYYLVILGIACSCWLVDQHLCAHMNSLPLGLPNPQLHAVWHLLSAIDSHLGILMSEILRFVIVYDKHQLLQQQQANTKTFNSPIQGSPNIQAKVTESTTIRLDWFMLLPFTDYVTKKSD